MAVRHALLTALAGVHLGLVLCGAVSLPLLSDDRPVTKALRLGRAMTGSDTNYGFFFQDDYRISSRLTLNLGLRYDYNSVLQGDLIGNFDIPTLTLAMRHLRSKFVDVDRA